MPEKISYYYGVYETPVSSLVCIVSLLVQLATLSIKIASLVVESFVHYTTVTNYVHTKPRHARVMEWPVERQAIEFTLIQRGRWTNGFGLYHTTDSIP